MGFFTPKNNKVTGQSRGKSILVIMYSTLSYSTKSMSTFCGHCSIGETGHVTNVADESSGLCLGSGRLSSDLGWLSFVDFPIGLSVVCMQIRTVSSRVRAARCPVQLQTTETIISVTLSTSLWTWHHHEPPYKKLRRCAGAWFLWGAKDGGRICNKLELQEKLHHQLNKEAGCFHVCTLLRFLPVKMHTAVK